MRLYVYAFSHKLEHCNALPNAINCFAFFFAFFVHLFLCLRSFLLFYSYFQFFCIFIFYDTLFILFEFTQTEKIKCELGSKIITVDSASSASAPKHHSLPIIITADRLLSHISATKVWIIFLF